MPTNAYFFKVYFNTNIVIGAQEIQFVVPVAPDGYIKNSLYNIWSTSLLMKTIIRLTYSDSIR
jgi:hypothetical protein